MYSFLFASNFLYDIFSTRSLFLCAKEITMTKPIRLFLISLCLVVSTCSLTACSAQEEQEHHASVDIVMNDVSLDSSQPDQQGASEFLEQWMEYVFSSDQGINHELKQLLDDHPELNEVNSDYSHFESLSEQEKKSFSI